MHLDVIIKKLVMLKTLTFFYLVVAFRCARKKRGIHKCRSNNAQFSQRFSSKRKEKTTTNKKPNTPHQNKTQNNNNLIPG